MKRLYLFAIGCRLSISLTNAQVRASHLQTFSFSVYHPINERMVTPLTFKDEPFSMAVKPETPVLKPYMNTFRYTAFFCKMELKAVDYFGIWIKVHAGDYDNYTKDTYAQP